MKRYIKILTLVFTLSFLWGCLEDPEVYKVIVKTDSTVEFVQGGVSLNGGIYTENEKYQPTIVSCGFCYGIEENPTLSNSVVKVKNSGVGDFNATLRSLNDGTRYYVRVFAQNKYGVVYGEEVSFVSLTKPTVKTLSLSEDNENSQLIVECELESLGSGGITELGVCYSSEKKLPNKENGEYKLVSNIQKGKYTVSIPVEPNVKYYVRAFATNLGGIAYGEVKEILTTEAIYTIKFDGNGGVGSMEDISTPQSKDVQLTLNSFTRTGYTFTGWNTKTDGSGTAYYDEQNISIDSDLTLYAQWTPIYTVTFNANGGSGGMSSKTVSVGSSISLPTTTFTRSGYEFVGWNTKTNGSGISYTNGQKITVSGDITLYAQWKKKDVYYTITFDSNGGSGSMSSKTVSAGTSFYLPINTFTSFGYEFVGWNTNAEGSGVSYTNGQRITPSRNITLYAQWTPIYTITFDANGGSGRMSSQTVSAGSSITLPSNTFTRSGYEFIGWNTNSYGTGTSYTDGQFITPPGNISLYAQWQDNLTGIANSHEWVDLGLPSGTLWATCNVGASKPEYYGDYFAWGETSIKSSYTSSNYIYLGDPTVLPLNKDAANVNWGGKWRMPTKAECQELLDNCLWSWEEKNGVEGYMVTSKTNNKSIFLPAVDANGDGYDYSGKGGYYWSSSLYPYVHYPSYNKYTDEANFLLIQSDYRNVSSRRRYWGLSVRPVMSK